MSFSEIDDVLWESIEPYLPSFLQIRTTQHFKRGIKSNIPVNKRNRKKKKIGRPIKVDQEEFKKKSIVERFFSWIESCKKVFPRYEIKEESYLGVVMVAAIIRLHEVLG